jgi:aspartyl-tRNA(Asn)/glutamyl-tRNA(Gln) amidotransferase subunit A
MTHDPYNAFIDIYPAASFGTGPLSAITVGVKSNIAVKGLPWTAGMELRRNIIADKDAEAVARLRKAGAKIIGTHNMHEAALGSTTDNAFYGRTHNPHRRDYTPGGSSGGSGAAVAAGLCDVALGTDTLGSVRIPAAYCGVYGLKPTADTIPEGGLFNLEANLDVIGLLARDLGQLELCWQAVASDPGQSGDTTRVLMLPEFAGVAVPRAIAAACDRASTALGLPVQSLELPATLNQIRLAAFADIGKALTEELGEAADGPGISDELRFVLKAALGMPSDAALQGQVKTALLSALGSDGVLLMPTAPQVAFPHTPRPPSSQPLFTGLANVAGCPALAIPAGRDEDGLPVSVQLLGPPHSEPRLIALARQLEPILGGFVAPPDYALNH